MRNTLVGELPKHLYVWIDSNFTHTTSQGFIKAVWFGLVAYPGRAWGLTVLLECGAVYRNLPPHAIAFDQDPEDWSIEDAQTWDCYGWDFTAIEYSYLSGLTCKVKANNKELVGQYLFSVAPVGDAYSASPDQAKEFSFIQVEDRLTIQPTNNVVFQERSFTDNLLEFPKDLKRQEEVYSVE